MKGEVGKYLTRSILVLVVAGFLFPVGSLAWLLLEVPLPVSYFGIGLVILVTGIYLKWLLDLASLKPREKQQRWKMDIVEGSAGIPYTRSGKTSVIFRHFVKDVLWEGDFTRFEAIEDAWQKLEEGRAIRLPNGRLIGSCRLRSVVEEMLKTNDLTWRKWRSQISRSEWHGTLSWLDQHSLIERVDGRGQAYVNQILRDDFTRFDSWLSSLFE